MYDVTAQLGGEVIYRTRSDDEFYAIGLAISAINDKLQTKLSTVHFQLLQYGSGSFCYSKECRAIIITSHLDKVFDGGTNVFT